MLIDGCSVFKAFTFYLMTHYIEINMFLNEKDTTPLDMSELRTDNRYGDIFGSDLGSWQNFWLIQNPSPKYENLQECRGISLLAPPPHPAPVSPVCVGDGISPKVTSMKSIEVKVSHSYTVWLGYMPDKENCLERWTGLTLQYQSHTVSSHYKTSSSLPSIMNHDSVT